MIDILVFASAAAMAVPEVAPPPPPLVVPVPQARLSEWKPGDGPRRPLPKNMMRLWLMPSDYPLEALKLDIEGDTVVDLSVDKEGKVKDCRVKASAGAAILDKEACRLAKQRARFHPALDEEGQAVSGVYSTALHWKQPAPSKNDFADGSFEIEFLVGTDGIVRDCRSKVVGKPLGMEFSDLNEPCAGFRRYQPFRDAEGKPVERRVRLEMKMTVGDQEASPDQLAPAANP